MYIVKQLTIVLALCSFCLQLLPKAYASSLMDEAVADFQQKRYNAAANLLEHVIKGEPKNANAYFYLGASLEQLKDLDDAKKMYEACFKLNPFSPLGRQAKDSINNLIQQQALIDHPYDAPGLVDTSVRNINQQVNHLQQDKMNFARIDAAYQIDSGNRRAYRLGLEANMAQYDYFGQAGAANEISNMALIRSYDALAYAQRAATRALTNGIQSSRYARESGNNLINSFNEQPFKPDEPQLRAAGTNLYIRNYSYTNEEEVPPSDPLVELKAVAGRLDQHAQASKINSKG